MARRIAAKLPYHVIATGMSASDFIALGRGDVFLQDSFTEADVSWHATYEQAMQHPAARDGAGYIERVKTLHAIDKSSGLSRDKLHAAKAREAERVLFDNVTDVNRLPFLAADCATRTDGCTLQQVAQEVWNMHAQDAQPEADRVEAKRQV